MTVARVAPELVETDTTSTTVDVTDSGSSSTTSTVPAAGSATSTTASPPQSTTTTSVISVETQTSNHRLVGGVVTISYSRELLCSCPRYHSQDIARKHPRPVRRRSEFVPRARSTPQTFVRSGRAESPRSKRMNLARTSESTSSCVRVTRLAQRLACFTRSGFSVQREPDSRSRRTPLDGSSVPGCPNPTGVLRCINESHCCWWRLGLWQQPAARVRPMRQPRLRAMLGHQRLRRHRRLWGPDERRNGHRCQNR